MTKECPFCGHLVKQVAGRLVCSRNKHHSALTSDGVFRDTSPWIKQDAEKQLPPFIRK